MTDSLTSQDVLDRAFAAAWNARRHVESERRLSRVDQRRTIVGAAITVVLTDLHALLYPERYPGYDPDHRFWANKTPEQIAAIDPESDVFEWDSETIELVASWVNDLLDEAWLRA